MVVVFDMNFLNLVVIALIGVGITYIGAYLIWQVAGLIQWLWQHRPTGRYYSAKKMTKLYAAQQQSRRVRAVPKNFGRHTYEQPDIESILDRANHDQGLGYSELDPTSMAFQFYDDFLSGDDK